MGAVSLKLDGEEIKTEQIEDFRDEKTLKWIAKMKGGFGVNEIKIDLTARSVASPFKVATNTTPSSGKKNFKTFVKKNNYKQQTTIVRTHPGVVSMDL